MPSTPALTCMPPVAAPLLLQFQPSETLDVANFPFGCKWILRCSAVQCMSPVLMM